MFIFLERVAGSLAFDRRTFVIESLGLAAAVSVAKSGCAAQPAAVAAEPQNSRRLGLVLGSLVGDALGGPIEFSSEPSAKQMLCDARRWPSGKTLTPPVLARLGEDLPLLGYDKLRPATASYGPWLREAMPGTITDDSRHKIVLQRAVRGCLRKKTGLTTESLANEYVQFRCRTDREDSEDLQQLVDEGFREYRYAARWLLGERDLATSRPPARLWSGVNNCSGQMLLLNMAIAYAGRSDAAYQAAFGIDFVDTPQARDFAAAIVAGLAAALDDKLEQSSPEERFEVFCTALRNTDPYEIAAVPFAGRRLNYWLDLADELVEETGGSPGKMYELLESRGEPKFWWDAHFTLLVPLCLLKLCPGSPLAAMHLALDFGHDTDSYAQVLGAIAGACYGAELFPERFRNAVRDRMLADYGEDPLQWPVEWTRYAELVEKEQNPAPKSAVAPSKESR